MTSSLDAPESTLVMLTVGIVLDVLSLSSVNVRSSKTLFSLDWLGC